LIGNTCKPGDDGAVLILGQQICARFGTHQIVAFEVEINQPFWPCARHDDIAFAILALLDLGQQIVEFTVHPLVE